MNTAFSEEALFAKSKIFIDRGLAARDSSDFGLFHTWAALALELLGKSSLAHVHPVLVADPTKFSSLLAACGRLETDDLRSIGAKTVYERLRSLSTQFDKRSEDFCMIMANRRNEELHSGSSPTNDLNPNAWVSEFWRVSSIIIMIGTRSLKDWVGDEEAASAMKLVVDSSRVLEEAVIARIRRCAAEFERKYPLNSIERSQAIEVARKAFWPSGMRDERLEYDAYEQCACPACGCEAWIFGFELGQHRSEPEFDFDQGWVQWVDTDYSSEAFACPTCSLRLSGRLELDLANLLEVFTKTEAADADYEIDYGND